MRSVPWQGSLDMLCGIYSAADIIARYGTMGGNGEYSDYVSRAFLSLLESAEKQGLLTAKKIAHPDNGGFRDYELASIFNGLTIRKRRGLVALAFRDSKFRSLRNSDCRTLIEAGAHAIIQEHGEDQWIALLGKHRDGGYYCFDPQLENETTRRERVRWRRGVLIAKPEIVENI